jgi:hypothetical protein
MLQATGYPAGTVSHQSTHELSVLSFGWLPGAQLIRKTYSQSLRPAEPLEEGERGADEAWTTLKPGERERGRGFEREPPLGPSPLAWLGVKPQYKQEASCI